MNTELSLLIFMILLSGGCAGDPAKLNMPVDQPTIQMPVQTAPPREETENFEDISLSAKARQLALTTRMDIDEKTQNYVNNGQADVIMRPDGTVLYPYGLARANLTAKKMMYSKIVLQEGEKILSAAAGDTVRWNILPDYLGSPENYTPVVLVKPFIGGLQTSLSVITDRRDYDIAIQSVDRGDYTARIGFYYPQDKADALHVGLPPEKKEGDASPQPRINIENIKYDYRIRGDHTVCWYPLSVFEDGNKVFIRMSDRVDRFQLPVFMAVDASGRKEMVNYRYFKPYYVIDTIFDQGVLTLANGKYSQTIKLIKTPSRH